MGGGGGGGGQVLGTKYHVDLEYFHPKKVQPMATTLLQLILSVLNGRLFFLYTTPFTLFYESIGCISIYPLNKVLA